MHVADVRIPSWHNVVVVQHFHERLNFRFLINLLLAHCLNDLSWVPIDTSDYDGPKKGGKVRGVLK